ncbi:MAG: ERF family protein [Ignavibacteriaceae bacterium]|nr:ERF family protein [Ignavibacteriaceae bacterium]
MMNDLAVKQNDSMMALVEKVVSDPNLDASKLEKLLDMQERIFDKNAEIAFNEDMAKVQSEIKPIINESHNGQTKSKYTKLDSIVKYCSPIWTSYGFALSFGSDKSSLENHIGITCIVSHSQGFSRNYRWDLPLDDVGIKGSKNKTAIHASGSTMSYGRRYLTCLIFNIVTQDDDDGNAANSTPRINNQQLTDLESLIKEVGADKAGFIRVLSSSCGGIEYLSQLPASNYDYAIGLLERKRKAS